MRKKTQINKKKKKKRECKTEITINSAPRRMHFLLIKSKPDVCALTQSKSKLD